MLKSFTIDDDLADQDQGSIDVIVTLENGRRRWCFFMTLETLRNCGDVIPGTDARIHYGVPHMIIVGTRLDETVIEQALRHIDSRGELENCTLPL